MKLFSIASLFFVTLVIFVTDSSASALRKSRRSETPLGTDSGNALKPTGVEGNANKTRPRGVFLFDDNCLWYLHGKGQLIAKINCVTPKRRPPVIVAQRRNGKMHYKLQHSSRPRTSAGKRNSSRRRGGRRNQIPLKCLYRYDEKGVFYLTRCYTHSRQFGAVEMNFHGHRPGDKFHRGSLKQRLRGGKHSRKRGKFRRHGRGRRDRSRLRRRFRKYRRHRMFKDGLKYGRRYSRAHRKRLHNGARKSKSSRKKKHSPSSSPKHKKRNSKKKKGKKHHHKKSQKKRTLVKPK